MLGDGVIYVHKLQWKICLQNKEAILVHQKGLLKNQFCAMSMDKTKHNAQRHLGLGNGLGQ